MFFRRSVVMLFARMVFFLHHFVRGGVVVFHRRVMFHCRLGGHCCGAKCHCAGNTGRDDPLN